MSHQSEEGEVEFGQEESEVEGEKRKGIRKRTQGERERRRGRGKGFVSSTYRKEKCDFYNKGACLKGDECTYSHDFEPDTVRKICKFFLSGACTKQKCQYSHNTKIYPCRFFHIENRCQQMGNCRFSHDPIAVDFYQEYMKDNKDSILKMYRENKLANQNLMEFIKDDLPRKEVLPPPLATAANGKVEAVTRTVLVNKDPRQRLVKPVAVAKSNNPQNSSQGSVQTEKRVKEQEKSEEPAQNLDQIFRRSLQKYFFTYN